MKLGIMQPYFMPYIGYWQLMNAVDQYVVYDDVNFIKGGWINRNRILIENEAKYFNIPMVGASSNKQINQIMVNNNVKLRDKNLRILENAYKKAPFFSSAMPVMEEILNCSNECLSEYILNSLIMVREYLGINNKLIVSSSLDKDNELKGEEKVISICQLLNATEYYNAIGGRQLYTYSHFEKYHIRLRFMQTEDIIYKQFNSDFKENLSMIDVMMFNSKKDIQTMLKRYRLIFD